MFINTGTFLKSNLQNLQILAKNMFFSLSLFSCFLPSPCCVSGLQHHGRHGQRVPQPEAPGARARARRAVHRGQPWQSGSLEQGGRWDMIQEMLILWEIKLVDWCFALSYLNLGNDIANFDDKLNDIKLPVLIILLLWTFVTHPHLFWATPIALFFFQLQSRSSSFKLLSKKM